MKIIIYHSNDRLVRSLERVFEQSCIHAESCADKGRFLDLSGYEKYTASLMVVSFGLEDIKATYLEWKRVCRDSVCIILSSNQSAYERVKMLELGVDQYHIEPYSYAQLVAEVVRYDYIRESNQENRLKTNYFSIDLLSRVAYCNGKLLILTKKEFDLLCFLVRRKGMVISRLQIWEELWGFQELPLANTVDVHINRLRKKIPSPFGEYITTFYGVGYRMREDA